MNRGHLTERPSCASIVVGRGPRAGRAEATAKGRCLAFECSRVMARFMHSVSECAAAAATGGHTVRMGDASVVRVCFGSAQTRIVPRHDLDSALRRRAQTMTRGSQGRRGCAGGAPA